MGVVVFSGIEKTLKDYYLFFFFSAAKSKKNQKEKLPATATGLLRFVLSATEKERSSAAPSFERLFPFRLRPCSVYAPPLNAGQDLHDQA
ncbi:MAG: hypothetical protein ACRDCS_00800 [Tannerellaceae bacterium]